MVISLEEFNSSTPNITVAINTITAGGHFLSKTERNPGYILIHTFRFDEFGTKLKYCFLIAEEHLIEDQIVAASISATHAHENLVAIGHGDIDSHIEWGSFINLFGGPVNRLSPIEPEFNDQLNILGHNQLPDGLSGKADDLFEIFVHSALEFILGGKVVRYGQARRFQECPDGLAIPNPRFCALYDTKAYKDGYEVTSDTIRQFESYIKDFYNKYSSWYRLNSFIIISGHFPHKPDTLENRSQELLAKTGVPLSFLDTSVLGSILTTLKESPLTRRSINWSQVLTRPIVNPKDVQKQVDFISQDQAIRR